MYQRNHRLDWSHFYAFPFGVASRGEIFGDASFKAYFRLATGLNDWTVVPGCRIYLRSTVSRENVGWRWTGDANVSEETFRHPLQSDPRILSISMQMSCIHFLRVVVEYFDITLLSCHHIEIIFFLRSSANVHFSRQVWPKKSIYILYCNRMLFIWILNHFILNSVLFLLSTSLFLFRFADVSWVRYSLFMYFSGWKILIMQIPDALRPTE